MKKFMKWKSNEGVNEIWDKNSFFAAVFMLQVVLCLINGLDEKWFRIRGSKLFLILCQRILH